MPVVSSSAYKLTLCLRIYRRCRCPQMPMVLPSGSSFQPAASGISTFSSVFRYLGRDFQPAATGISTFSTDSVIWVEIYKRRHQESLPFRPFSAIWVEIYERRHQESLPFRLIFPIWVEISKRRHWESLPFRPFSAIWVEIFLHALSRRSTGFLRYTAFPAGGTGFPTGHGVPGGNPMTHTYIRHSNYINGSTFRHDQAEARATTLHTKNLRPHSVNGGLI